MLVSTFIILFPSFAFPLIPRSRDQHKMVVNVCLCYKIKKPLSSISGQLIKFQGEDTLCISSLSTLQQYNCIIPHLMWTKIMWIEKVGLSLSWQETNLTLVMVTSGS
jgi:hypothetical protein